MITIARRKVGQHCNFYLYHDERLEISFTTRGRRGESPVLEQLLAVFFSTRWQGARMYQSNCGICTNVHLHRTPPVLSPLIPIHPSWFSSKTNTRKKRGRRKKKGNQRNSRDQIYLERRDIAIESSAYSRRRKRTCLLNASSSSCVTT